MNVVKYLYHSDLLLEDEKDWRLSVADAMF